MMVFRSLNLSENFNIMTQAFFHDGVHVNWSLEVFHLPVKVFARTILQLCPLFWGKFSYRCFRLKRVEEWEFLFFDNSFLKIKRFSVTERLVFQAVLGCKQQVLLRLIYSNPVGNSTSGFSFSIFFEDFATSIRKVPGKHFFLCDQGS